MSNLYSDIFYILFYYTPTYIFTIHYSHKLTATVYTLLLRLVSVSIAIRSPLFNCIETLSSEHNDAGKGVAFSALNVLLKTTADTPTVSGYLPVNPNVPVLPVWKFIL